MEIRIDNTITLNEAEKLRKQLGDFFNVDFSAICDGSYIYFREDGKKTN